ncbi:MAG: TIGR00730 family Rossman fold protein [Paludibacteraceae bacterium]
MKILYIPMDGNEKEKMYFCKSFLIDKRMKKICVYCASSSKIDSSYVETARKLGEIFAKNGIDLIYGGGSVGLMGTLADAVMNANGKVVGVIPRFMCDVEWHHKGISELILTETMHERKQMMADLADAVVALPGGCGTMEELMEVITWKQLGIFNKPIVILNANNYYDHLIAQLEHSVNEHFMIEKHKDIWSVVNCADAVLESIENAKSWDESARNFAKI